jgi:hypothetical protein
MGMIILLGSKVPVFFICVLMLLCCSQAVKVINHFQLAEPVALTLMTINVLLNIPRLLFCAQCPHRIGRVRLTVDIFLLRNCLTDVDEIWYLALALKVVG